MRITVRHHQPFPLTLAVACAPGSSDRAVARAAARAARWARGGGPAPAVSLSHRDGRGAAALAPAGTAVGVDLERTGTVPAARERLFATAAERGAPGRPRDAAVLWCLKEAAWKAFRCPPELPFTDLELELVPGLLVAAVRLGGRRRAVRALLRRPWRGWVLAAVWTEEGA